MKFELLRVIDTMLGLYQSPVNADRFTHYMSILQGSSPGDISVPVTFFNPMGKEHVLKKLLELKELQAEELIQETLETLNKQHSFSLSTSEIKVSLALADDLGGGWTNRFTTDYDSKFNVNDLIKRNFCNPVFWVSEAYTAPLIKERTADYCYRMLYRSRTPQPVTLEDHIRQETYVAMHNTFRSTEKASCDFQALNRYFEYHKQTSYYPPIFNFLYGDAASRELGHTAFGVKEAFAGYSYATILALNESGKSVRST